jgi:uncharacterized protein YegP (UPF0339 family)
MSSARFEVVHADAGHFARFVAANGKEVWRTSETYTRRRGAVRAVELYAGPIRHSPFADWPEVSVSWSEWPLEVRDVDERTVTGAQPDEPASQAGRPVAGGGS